MSTHLVYRPIESYALVGNGHTASLVSSQGSVDWLCQPRFDSPSIFARILDLDKGGYWSLCPTQQHHSNNHYMDDTNVLRTRFLTDDGVVHVIDFMPTAEGSDHAPHELIRIVEGVEGEVEVESVCAPRPNYGRSDPDIRIDGKEVTFSGCMLRGPSEWWEDADRHAMVSKVKVRAKERVAFVLRFEGSNGSYPAKDPSELLDSTLDYWRWWVQQCSYEGPYRKAVVRSALVLKMLIYSPTNAILAAPTTSLPEELGGSLNWDYRYTWIRDASLTLYALLLAGFENETDKFFQWIVDTVKLRKTGIKIMHSITHEENLEEQELDHWEGYRGSGPVRIGNEASGQLQLDVYGEVLDALHFAWKAGRYNPADVWEHFRPLVDWVADHWREPDNGIWEIRGQRKHYVYSEAMCWVALDRGIKIAKGNSLPGDTERWKQEREMIRKEVLERGWSDKLKAFKQSYENERMDAANLRLSPVGFLDGDDPRMVSTIDSTLNRLVTNDLCYRYLNSGSASIAGSEGTFLACTFWLINALILAKRGDQAEEMFRNVVEYASPLGLYSEEMDPSSRSQIGNFPQALSHIGLISSAVSLAHGGVSGKVRSEHAQAATKARASSNHKHEE